MEKNPSIFLKTISISEIWKLSPNLGLLLLDTTLGVLSERKAKKKRVGGIISAYIRP
jgi:ribosomal protein S8